MGALRVPPVPIWHQGALCDLRLSGKGLHLIPPLNAHSHAKAAISLHAAAHHEAVSGLKDLYKGWWWCAGMGCVGGCSQFQWGDEAL